VHASVCACSQPFLQLHTPVLCAPQPAVLAPLTAFSSDSDNDGQTNGFELGDPCCVWAEGQTPQFTTAISNPGSSSSKTSRACDVVCANGRNPCNLPTPTTSAPSGPAPAPSQTTAAPATTSPAAIASCGSHTSCNTCASSLSCGWCSKSAICAAGSENGSSDSKCLRSAGAWVWGAHACDAAKSGQRTSAFLYSFFRHLRGAVCETC
jgi:hypothetical protein